MIIFFMTGTPRYCSNFTRPSKITHLNLKAVFKPLSKEGGVWEGSSYLGARA